MAAIALSPAASSERGVVFEIPVDVTPQGHSIDINWAPVPGATKAEVDTASLRIASNVLESSLGSLPVSTSGGFLSVSVPGGQRVKSFTLSGLKSSDKDVPDDLNVEGTQFRMIVATPGTINGWSQPVLAVRSPVRNGLLGPEIPRTGLSGGVVGPLNLAAARIGIGLVTGDHPEDFAMADISAASVTAIASILPKDLQLVGPDGAVIWSFPGEFPLDAPEATVDLRTPLEKALNAALSKKAPLAISFQLRTSAPASAFVNFSGASGALVKTYAGVVKAKLEGDPVPLPLPEPPPTEIPSTAIGDITIHYLGIRILENVSDAVPANGGAGGTIVSGEAVTQAYPPAGLNGQKLAKIGVIGRAPEDCELSVRLVDMSAGTPGKTLFAPGVAKVKASNSIGTIWLDLPKNAAVDGPAGISVRANTGRFFWAASEHLLSRVAVFDPAPGSRPLTIAGGILVPIKDKDTNLPAMQLPPGAFAGAAPAFGSDLFLAIEVSDLALRYRR